MTVELVGIQGHNVSNSLIFNNHLHHIGWQNVERYWECAAIKILMVRNSLATDNIIHDIEGASAILVRLGHSKLKDYPKYYLQHCT